jgi:hypothetical protein
MILWIIAIIAAIFIVAASARAFARKKQRPLKAPVDVANSILRYPERILLDVPAALARRIRSDRAEFLRAIEAELGKLGGLEIRRELLLRLADFYESPSSKSIKELNAFITRPEIREFRNVLGWQGHCHAALAFFSLAGRLAGILDGERPKQNLSRGFVKEANENHDKAMKELQGEYRDMEKQWFCLLQGLYKVVESEIPSAKRKKKKGGGTKTAGAFSKKLTRETDPPKALIEESKAVGLAEFQEVSRTLFISYRDRMFGDNQRSSR